MNTIRNAKFVQGKSKKCQDIVRLDDKFVVNSPSGRHYYVEFLEDGGATCTCKWGKYRPWWDSRSACSHVAAVLRAQAAGDGKRVSFWKDRTDALRQHRPLSYIGDNIWVTYRSASA